MTVLRFLLLVVLLNVVRYVVGPLVEAPLILPRLFGAMEASPEVFRTSFTTFDWVTSYGYNFLLWLSISWLYHLARPALRGGELARSLAVFGVGWLFFAALSFVYMNHYAHPRDFYLWNVADALVVFPIVALANAWLYPRLLGVAPARSSSGATRRPA